MKKLISFNTQILCCNTCLKERKMTDEDLIDGVIRVKGPQILEAKEKCAQTFDFM